jgi:F-type H+-transporting ATPase subunit delta
MQFASREALANARERFEPLIADTSTAAVRSLADELFAVAGVLGSERTLRRLLSDPATSERRRRELADAVFGGKVSDQTLRTVQDLVASRWSRTADLIDAIEALARDSVFAIAERDEVLEDVEDQLFRFSRTLSAEPRLQDLLADGGKPLDGRLQLLDGLVSAKVQPATSQLLRQTIRLARGRLLDSLIERLAELAAERRGRSVANVTAAAPLTAEQERRLTEDLSRIYGRSIDIHVELDPSLLGGLVIRVGDEMIDGSVAARLAQARQRLSG